MNPVNPATSARSPIVASLIKKLTEGKENTAPAKMQQKASTGVGAMGVALQAYGDGVKKQRTAQEQAAANWAPVVTKEA